MIRVMLPVAVLGSLAIALVLASGFRFAPSVSAQLGTTGVPVRCFAVPAPTNTLDMSCIAADGTAMPTVPSGHYLLVTDVEITPVGVPGEWFVVLNLMTGTAINDQVTSRLDGQRNYGAHYVSPLWVVSAGQHLEAYDSFASAGPVNVYVRGLLTTNYDYLPLVVR